jgi:hypothetical protein
MYGYVPTYCWHGAYLIRSDKLSRLKSYIELDGHKNAPFSHLRPYLFPSDTHQQHSQPSLTHCCSVLKAKKSFGNPHSASHQGTTWVTTSLSITKTSRPGVNITNRSGRLRTESGSLSELQETDSRSTQTDRGSSSSRMLSDGPMTTRDGSSSKTITTTTKIDRGHVLRMVHDFPAVVGAWLVPWPRLIAALDVSGTA